MRPNIRSSFFAHGLYLVSITQFMKYLPMQINKKSGKLSGLLPWETMQGRIDQLPEVNKPYAPQPDIPLAYSVTCIYSVNAGAPRAVNMQVIER